MKPHFFFKRGLWRCKWAGRVSVGYTPLDALLNWPLHT